MSVVPPFGSHLAVGFDWPPVKHSRANVYILGTIGIFRRPDKLEAIRDFVSPKADSNRRTRFHLYTRRNADNSQELTIGNEELLRQSWFDPRLPIKLVVNGWLDNRYVAKWVRTGVNALLSHGNYNVIYVGWKSIQELFVAAFMIKFFSEDLAQFLIFIKVLLNFCHNLQLIEN